MDGAELLPGPNDSSPSVIYVVDLAERPFGLAAAARGLGSAVVRVPVRCWGDSLTPWPARGLRPGEPDFGGRAATTLRTLVDEAVPALESRFALEPARRAICGYSLGGLFSLYAFARDATFSACACLSGSLWYPGWVDRLRVLPFEGEGRYAYFSIGKKERRAGPPVMRTVQDDLETCARICRERGCAVDVAIGPGGHMQHHTERLAAGLAALDAFLAGTRA